MENLANNHPFVDGNKMFLLPGLKAFRIPWMLVIAIFCHQPEAIAQVRYMVGIDAWRSPSIGAENLIAIHRAVYALEDRYLKSRLFDETTKVRKSAGMLYRLGKTFLLDNVMDHLPVLTQHEIFGHGARYREFGYQDISYHLSLFPPYGRGNGWAHGSPNPERRGTWHERISSTIAGSEANTILSKSVRSKWLHRGRVKSRETVIYLFSSLDLSWYILRTRFTGRPRPGNDITNYLRNLNSLEGYHSRSPYRLTLEDLSSQLLVNLLNPTLFWAVYTYLVPYLYHGEHECELPMVRFGQVGYLPSFRLGLSPFGSEVIFENLIIHSGRVMNVFFRYGIPAFHQFGGLGIAVDNLASRKYITFSPRAELWHQPALLLGGQNVRTGRSGWGGGLWGTIRYRVARRNPAPELALEIGYKTDGFVEGEQLRRGFTLRLGLSLAEF